MTSNGWMDADCSSSFLSPQAARWDWLLPPSCLICLYDWQQFPALVIGDFKFAKVATLHYHIRDQMMTSKPSPIRIFSLVADRRAPARASVCHHGNLERWRKELQHFFFFFKILFCLLGFFFWGGFSVKKPWLSFHRNSPTSAFCMLGSKA